MIPLGLCLHDATTMSAIAAIQNFIRSIFRIFFFDGQKVYRCLMGLPLLLSETGSFREGLRVTGRGDCPRGGNQKTVRFFEQNNSGISELRVYSQGLIYHYYFEGIDF